MMSVVDSIITQEEFDSLTLRKKSVNIMMGQTFDYGQPFDMIKYAIFIMNLSDDLKSRCIDVSANWLIADHFISDINRDEERNEVRRQAQNRIEFLNRLNKGYGGNIGFVSSSELSCRSDYQQNLASFRETARNDSAFRERILKSIPADKRSDNAIDYPLEELATIASMKADIKVGPTREVLYDEPARDRFRFLGLDGFVSIYLSNCYPLRSAGQIVGDVEVDKFGITPYKINSKSQRIFRVDPLSDDVAEVDKLIDGSDQRGIDCFIDIVGLARERLGGSKTIYSDARALAKAEYRTYVAEVLR